MPRVVSSRQWRYDNEQCLVCGQPAGSLPGRALDMDTAVVSAASAILGSLVGGSASMLTAYMTQRTQARRTEIQAEMHKREVLYTDYIAECSKLALDSMQHSLESPDTFQPAYALVNRIRLVSSRCRPGGRGSGARGHFREVSRAESAGREDSGAFVAQESPRSPQTVQPGVSRRASRAQARRSGRNRRYRAGIGRVN